MPIVTTRIKFGLNDVDPNSLWLEVSLKKPHGVRDRLRSNRYIKSHRMTNRCSICDRRHQDA